MASLKNLAPADRWQPAAERAGVIAGQMAQLNTDLVELMADVLDSGAWAGDGIKSPAHWLMVTMALSPAHAHDVVAVARRRGDFPELESDMAAGRVSLDQMVVVAKHVPTSCAHEMAGFVPQSTVPQLRRVLGKYQFTPPPGPEDPPPPRPRIPEEGTTAIIHDAPRLSMSTIDGRFHLKFEANATDGALVEAALREAKDALFTAGQHGASLADALLEMASRSLTVVGSTDRRSHYKVLIHLDTEGRGWLNRKGALPAHLMEQFTCGDSVRPVWETDGQPVSVGRSMRIVPRRTRALIEDRDGGCRYPGCTASSFLENHHIQHWRDGGSTDMDTLVSLCPRHHRDHHAGHFSITGDPSTPDGLVFRGHGGWTIGPEIPDDIPAPRHPPPQPQPTRGWSMDTSCIHFSPARAPAA